MKHNCYVKRYNKPSFNAIPRECLSTEKVDVDGRIVSRSIMIVDDPAIRYDGLERNHFYLENMINNGVELKSCSLYGGDLLATTHVIREFNRLSELKKSLKNE